MFLIFFTVAAWYEGSTILDNPWEWKYSAIFTQLLHGEVVNQHTISQLDYFVYAAKFKPAYPSTDDGEQHVSHHTDRIPFTEK